MISRRTKVDDTFNMKRCITWFKRYCTPEDPDVLAPEGMERFCKDIQVDPENIVMLGKSAGTTSLAVSPENWK